MTTAVDVGRKATKQTKLLISMPSMCAVSIQIWIHHVQILIKLHCFPKSVVILEKISIQCTYMIKKGNGIRPRGGTLIFSRIRRLGPFFWVQNSEFQYFFGFSEKLIFFRGMKILWIFFWVITKMG